MRQLLQQIRARIDAFLDQRTDVAMALGVADRDAMPILTILEGVEIDRESDLVWTQVDPFVDAARYAEAVVRGFMHKHAAVRAALPADAAVRWPDPPEPVTCADTPPAARLRGLLAFSRDLLPVAHGGISLWIFFPLTIDEPAAYARLMRDVTAHEFPFPWCHHLRFIVRHPPGDPAIAALLAGAPRVQAYTPDLSREALDRSIADAIADPSTGVEERMNLQNIAACNDLAHHAYPAALAKFTTLLRHHGERDNHAMVALALHGMAQVHERTGELDKSGQAYEAALVPASHGRHPPHPILLNVILGLAELRATQERWAEAAGYFDAAHDLATPLRDGPLKVRMLARRGDCEQAQTKLAEADKTWHTASVLAARLGDPKLCADVLERRHALHVRRRDTAEARALHDQLIGLGRQPGRQAP